MKKITRDVIVNDNVYSVPCIEITKNELTYWSVQAQKFYAQTYNDLDFRVEPYTIEPTE